MMMAMMMMDEERMSNDKQTYNYSLVILFSNSFGVYIKRKEGTHILRESGMCL